MISYLNLRLEKGCLYGRVMEGPFFGKRPAYKLAFKPDTSDQYLKDIQGQVIYDEYNDPTPNPAYNLQGFSLEAHLGRATLRDAARIGRDNAEGLVRVLFCNPKEGDSRVRHESVCTVSPDFMGLRGTLTIQAGPESGFYAVKEAIGVSVTAEFKEG